MNAFHKAASLAAVSFGLLFPCTADLQAAPRVVKTVPSPGTANLGAAAGFRSAMSGTARQGITVRASNLGNFNALNFGVSPFGAFPGMYGGFGRGYPGLYGGIYGGGYGGTFGGIYPGIYGGGYPGTYGALYPGTYGGGYPGMYGSSYPGLYGTGYPGTYGGYPNLLPNPFGY
jgi:hypothetical protein